MEKFTFPFVCGMAFVWHFLIVEKGLIKLPSWAGHKSIQTNMRYWHQGRDQKHQIVDELAQAFSL